MVAGKKSKISVPMKNYWYGKLALITGASSGIGANIAEYLSAKGMRVILVARRLDKLESIASHIAKKGGKAYVFQTDLLSPAARAELIQNIVAQIGIPDVLINNAGIGWYGYFHSMPWEIANEVIELNISALTHITSLLLPRMLQLPRARIINIGSIAGKLPEQGISLYSASKAYLDAFTTSLYRELRGTNVSASVIRAGPVKTEFFDRAIQLPEGGRIPGEKFAIRSERVSEGIWRLIQHPHRYSYIPLYLSISPLLEILFSWALDLVGPILLRSNTKQKTFMS
jgi:uncharacterized protein